MRIKKGDTVKIVSGKDRGKTGKVLEVFPVREKISVDGINLYKKHVRPKKQGEKGQLVTLIRPFAVSNVMLVCGSCKKPTRIGYEIHSGKKQRVCKKCKAAI